MDAEDKTKEQLINELVEMRHRIAELEALETERGQAEETLKRRLEQLTSLNRASQAVAASLELDQVLAEIVSLAGEVVTLDYASVALVDEEGRLSRSTEDLPGVPALDGRIRAEGFANWIIQSRQAAVVDDIAEDGTIQPRPANGAPGTANTHVIEAGVKSFVGLPLVAKDRLLGVLFLHSLRPGNFRGQLPLLTTFANQAAVAIENARLFEQAQREIAERKQVEEALAHERDLLHALMDNIPDTIYFKDAASRFTRINRAQAQVLGVNDPREAIGKTDFDFFTAEHARDAYADEQKIVRSGQPLIDKVEKIRRADGEFRWVSATKVPIVDTEGRATGIVGISRDITAHKRAEDLLRIQRDLGLALSATSDLTEILNRLLEATFQIEGIDCGGVYLVDRLTGGLDLIVHKGLSPQFVESISHHDVDSPQVRLVMAGKPIYQRRSEFPLAIREDLRRESLRSLTVIPVQYEGQVIAVLNLASHTHDKVPVSARHAIEVIATQIGSVIARVRAEAVLRESEARYRELADSITDIFFAMDKDLRYIYWNRASEELTGISAKDAIGKSLCEIFPDIRGTKVEELYLEALRTQQPQSFVNEYQLGGKDFFFEISVYPSRDGISVFTKDITERKQAEEALAAEKERLAVTLRSIGDGVITTDTEGTIVLINKVAERLTGWTEEEAIGQPLGEVFHIINEKTRQPCENPVEKVLESDGGIVGLTNQTVLVTRDGTERILADSGAPIHDKDSKIVGVVLVFRDVTERRKMEAELLKASKLESIGVLAGGIAHDFNNILMAIMGNVSFARMKLDPEDEIFEPLTAAEKASLRAKDLTRQLLTFARGGTPVKRTASMAELIKDSADFALRGSNVRCEFSIPNDLWPVEVDEGQMSQVVNNLVINADQAMPKGGTIKIRAENATVGPEQALPLKGGQYVKVSFEDQGIGIPEEHLPKIFDPYFTTKQKGSGLGLATSFSIVRNHEGHITVESELGVGTTFYVYLPASQKELPTQKKEEEKLLVGRGRVLVMDDEEMVRSVAGRMLRHVGYQVDFARDGAEAIELYQEALECGQPFEVVLMDLTIPGGMGGKEAIKKLLEIDPGVKAIVSSGYSNDPIMSEFKRYGFRGVVAKPYEIVELSKTVDRVIMGMGK